MSQSGDEHRCWVTCAACAPSQNPAQPAPETGGEGVCGQFPRRLVLTQPAQCEGEDGRRKQGDRVVVAEDPPAAAAAGRQS